MADFFFVEFNIHFGHFFQRGRYAKAAYSIIKFGVFGDPRVLKIASKNIRKATQKETKEDLGNPKRTKNNLRKTKQNGRIPKENAKKSKKNKRKPTEP